MDTSFIKSNAYVATMTAIAIVSSIIAYNTKAEIEELKNADTMIRIDVELLQHQRSELQIDNGRINSRLTLLREDIEHQEKLTKQIKEYCDKIVDFLEKAHGYTQPKNSN